MTTSGSPSRVNALTAASMRLCAHQLGEHDVVVADRAGREAARVARAGGAPAPHGRGSGDALARDVRVRDVPVDAHAPRACPTPASGRAAPLSAGRSGAGHVASVSARAFQA